MLLEVSKEIVEKSILVNKIDNNPTGDLRFSVLTKCIYHQYNKGDLIEIEILADKKIKGWLYSKVTGFVFNIDGNNYCIGAQSLRQAVESRCKTKEFSKTIEENKLTKVGERVVTGLSTDSFLKLYSETIINSHRNESKTI